MEKGDLFPSSTNMVSNNNQIAQVTFDQTQNKYHTYDFKETETEMELKKSSKQYLGRHQLSITKKGQNYLKDYPRNQPLQKSNSKVTFDTSMDNHNIESDLKTKTSMSPQSKSISPTIKQLVNETKKGKLCNLNEFHVAYNNYKNNTQLSNNYDDYYGSYMTIVHNGVQDAVNSPTNQNTTSNTVNYISGNSTEKLLNITNEIDLLQCEDRQKSPTIKQLEKETNLPMPSIGRLLSTKKKRNPILLTSMEKSKPNHNTNIHIGLLDETIYKHFNGRNYLEGRVKNLIDHRKNIIVDQPMKPLNDIARNQDIIPKKKFVENLSIRKNLKSFISKTQAPKILEDNWKYYKFEKDSEIQNLEKNENHLRKVQLKQYKTDLKTQKLETGIKNAMKKNQAKAMYKLAIVPEDNNPSGDLQSMEIENPYQNRIRTAKRDYNSLDIVDRHSSGRPSWNKKTNLARDLSSKLERINSGVEYCAEKTEDIQYIKSTSARRQNLHLEVQKMERNRKQHLQSPANKHLIYNHSYARSADHKNTCATNSRFNKNSKVKIQNFSYNDGSELMSYDGTNLEHSSRPLTMKTDKNYGISYAKNISHTHEDVLIQKGNQRLYNFGTEEIIDIKPHHIRDNICVSANKNLQHPYSFDNLNANFDCLTNIDIQIQESPQHRSDTVLLPINDIIDRKFGSNNYGRKIKLFQDKINFNSKTYTINPLSGTVENTINNNSTLRSRKITANNSSFDQSKMINGKLKEKDELAWEGRKRDITERGLKIKKLIGINRSYELDNFDDLKSKEQSDYKRKDKRLNSGNDNVSKSLDSSITAVDIMYNSNKLSKSKLIEFQDEIVRDHVDMGAIEQLSDQAYNIFCENHDEKSKKIVQLRNSTKEEIKIRKYCITDWDRRKQRY